jgi:hypothetical protein
MKTQRGIQAWIRYLLVLLGFLSMQGCVQKLVVSLGKPTSGQVQGATGGGGGAGGQLDASGEVTVDASLDFAEDDVECDTEGVCSAWVDVTL